MINLNLNSQKLLNEFQGVSALKQQEYSPILDSLDLPAFLSWFDEQAITSQLPSQLQQEIEYILPALHAELLHDLCTVIEGNAFISNKSKNDLSRQNILKFTLLTSAGLLVAACEGFDCIATIMSTFSLPSALIVASGILLSALSIVAFCGLRLFQLSASLDIELVAVPRFLDAYLRQLDEIKRIRKKIARYSLVKLSEDELEHLVGIISMLEQRFVPIEKASEQVNQILHNGRAHIVKLAFSAIAAVLFFGGSFCAAQTVALSTLGLIMATAVTPASLSVLFFSTFVGIAALSLYWCVDFPGLKSIVGDWVGLDEAKITALCDRDSLSHEKEKLAFLKEGIEDIFTLKKQLASVAINSTTVKESVTKAEKVKLDNSKVSGNIYLFVNRTAKHHALSNSQEEESSNLMTSRTR